MPRARRQDGRPRIVFDTNVVVSALLFSRGRLAVVSEAWRIGQAVPLVSRATTEELLRVFAYPKFKLSDSDREDLLAEFLPFAEIITIADPPPMTPPCRDPHDVPFLELAITAKAAALVTGDADLQTLAERFPIPILTPELWLADLSGQ
jgi:uncharacterized protein